MALSLDDIVFLQSDCASRIMADHADSDLSAGNTLTLITKLRKSLTLSEAGAVLTTLRLRKKAAKKFPRFANEMLFTEDGLQQASHPLVRRYRARALESSSVLDLCCGIGADSLAFAAAGHHVLGLDIDPVRIAIAGRNAEVMALNAVFQVADVGKSIPDGFEGIFYDPGRRDRQGRRIHHVEHYLPPLSLARAWKAQDITVKLSPGVDLRQLESYGGQVEFVSVKGQLTEALLRLRRPTSLPMATLLIGSEIHHLFHRGLQYVEITIPRNWLFEPDPAVLRAGLVQDLAIDLNATMLEETIAYLTMDERSETPWGRYWKILDWMPFQLKRLRRYLIEHGVGHVTVKKRGFPMTPEELIARLRLRQGDLSRILVMTRHHGKPVVIICARS